MDVIVDEEKYNSDYFYPEEPIAKAVEDALGIDVIACNAECSWDLDKYMKGEVK